MKMGNCSGNSRFIRRSERIRRESLREKLSEEPVVLGVLCSFDARTVCGGGLGRSHSARARF
jgi:hypothetical protein